MFTPVFLLKYLERSLNDFRSQESLAASRMRKFRDLVTFVGRQSPYYARLIRENNISTDNCSPEDFPVLTKQLLMQRFDEIVTVPGIRKSRIADFLSRSKDPRELYRGHIVLHTSGSSGEIGYFVYSPDDWARGMAQYSRGHPHSFLKRRKAAYFGAIQGHFAGVTQFITMERSFLRLLYRVRCFDINDPLRKVVDGLNAFQPNILTGYPSGLLMLARKQMAGELRISPFSCEFGGEPLSQGDRQTLETAFGAPVWNFYASTEHMLMAAGGPGPGGMSLCEDDLIFELHDDHTCVTNLFNRTLPLIRYRMEDILKPQPSPDTGATCRTIEDLVGRMEQAPVFLNRRGEEDFISPFIFIEFQAKNLRRFRIVIESMTSFRFLAVLEAGLTFAEREAAIHEIEAGLMDILHQKEMDNVRFRIEATDDLPVDPRTGKFKLIVR
jgi:phenylacetate-coenzyme A ligase PaaK-like adenylate-forming protein